MIVVHPAAARAESFASFLFLAERYVTPDNWAFERNQRQMTAAEVGDSTCALSSDTYDAVCMSTFVLMFSVLV